MSSFMPTSRLPHLSCCWVVLECIARGGVGVAVDKLLLLLLCNDTQQYKQENPNIRHSRSAQQSQ
jgi:hypothetical protein